MSPHFDSLQWTLLVSGAFCVGLSKTGLPGLGVLFVALFANALPARAATGVVLPMLIVGDILATLTYRRHLVWTQLWRLFPWTVAGVVAGWLALGKLSDASTARLVGLIIFLMLGVHFWRKQRDGADTANRTARWWVPAGTGVLAGFCTLVANAAGPIMNIYLLAMRLPKLEFMGTGAAFFLLLNWFKVPFMVNLGLITPASLVLNLWLVPAVIVGAFAGRWAIGRINQKWFEITTLGLTACAALKLFLA
jgi:uncharacterized membrane protein YfcA